jgi:hypothetical protein
MTTQEQRAMQMLGTTEEGFRKIQEAHKLFRGLWDDDSFIELWKSIPDEACEALFYAVERLAKKDEEASAKDTRIYQLQQTIHACAERLVHEYAENGSETTKEVGIEAVGEREFYAMLLEGGYDLNEYDREDIANLLR